MRLVKAVILSFLVCFAGLVAKGAENPALGAISFDVASVVAGNSLRGTVTLNRPAPFDLAVSLAADPADGARLPASVTVPAGAVSAGFTISTPISKTAVGGSDSVVTIYGNYGVTRRASFTILAPVSFDEMVDRVVEREHAFVNNMKRMHPLIETYIQNLHEDKSHNVAPLSDRYFLRGSNSARALVISCLKRNSPACAISCWHPSGRPSRGNSRLKDSPRWSCWMPTSRRATTTSISSARSSWARCAALWWTCSRENMPPRDCSREEYGSRTAISTLCVSMVPTRRARATATTCTLTAGA